jgi:hypothetical protein
MNEKNFFLQYQDSFHQRHKRIQVLFTVGKQQQEQATAHVMLLKET